MLPFLPPLFDNNLLKMAAIYYWNIFSITFPTSLHLLPPTPLPFSLYLKKKRSVLSLGELWGRQVMLQGSLILFSLPPPCLSISLFACMCLPVEFLAYVRIRSHRDLAAASALGLTWCLRLISWTDSITYRPPWKRGAQTKREKGRDRKRWRAEGKWVEERLGMENRCHAEGRKREKRAKKGKKRLENKEEVRGFCTSLGCRIDLKILIQLPTVK